MLCKCSLFSLIVCGRIVRVHIASVRALFVLMYSLFSLFYFCSLFFVFIFVLIFVLIFCYCVLCVRMLCECPLRDCVWSLYVCCTVRWRCML